MNDERLMHDIKAYLNTLHSDYYSRILDHKGNAKLLKQKIERLEAELKEVRQ